ncbi:MAG: hypothetical protein ACE5D6_09140, partial [Candidatus Zixiibacteriota bacterium]
YEMLFNPISFVLLLSRGELEAKELLQRIKSMYSHLPYWMRPKEIVASSKTEWRLSNNSTALSLSSRRGDSYSATHVLIDEAALLHRANISLNQVLLNLAPTVGKNGKLFLISKTDKNKPESTFNSMYRAALTKSSDYTAAFIPYYVVPGRDKKWYNEQCEMSLSIDDTLDYVYESYPSTPEEALAPKSADKRLPYRWLEQCYHPIDPVLIVNNKLYDDVSVAIDYPEVPGLIIYKEPEDSRYLIVADPSEGTEGGDDAALIVFDIINKEEVATYTGKSEPSTLGGYIVKISEYYNYAAVLPERNHHGSALILWLKENSDIRIIQGWSPTERSRKPGWNTSAVSKSLAYDKTAEFLRKNECIIHNTDTFKQLSSIESSTLKAPGKRGDDDLAICFAIGIAGIELCLPKFSVSFLTIA